MLFYPKLPKIIGSDSLEDRIRSIHGAKGRRDASACHVFGHTHFCWDAVVDGIRYLSNPPFSLQVKSGNYGISSDVVMIVCYVALTCSLLLYSSVLGI